MSLHAEPLIYVLRWYEGDKSYEARDPYDSIAIVEMLGPKRAYVCGLHGVMNLKFRRAVAEFFKGLGVELVETERHGEARNYEVSEEGGA